MPQLPPIVSKAMDSAKESLSLQDKPRDVVLDGYPMRISPAFIHHNGLAATVCQLYVQQGSNRMIAATDGIDFIPNTPSAGVDLYMFVQDMLLTGDEKQKMIIKNAHGNKKSIDDTLETGSAEDSDDAGVRNSFASQVQDYTDYEAIADADEQPIVFSRLLLVVVGASTTAVEQQLEAINTSLKTSHGGAQWLSVAGDQASRLRGIYKPLEISSKIMSATVDNYAGIVYNVSRGLVDKKGIPIGFDAYVSRRSSALFDFNGSTQELALVAMPSSATMQRYAASEEEDVYDSRANRVPPSSVILQATANHVVMNGSRAHHIVLNDFDYLGGRFYRPVELSNEIFKYYDAQKVTINPLQAFGDERNPIQAYDRMNTRIVNIFDLLRNLELDEPDRALLLSALTIFSETRGDWSSTVADKPQLGMRIFGERAGEPTRPLLPAFLSSLTSMATEYVRRGLHEDAARLRTLEKLLSAAMMTHTAILARHTAITDLGHAQTIYDFSNITNRLITQVQFVNISDYLFAIAGAGDIVCIHGANKLFDKTLGMVTDPIQEAQKRGVRFVFGFDEITPSANSSGHQAASIFSAQGRLYSNLSKDVDWSLVGRLSADELAQYEKALGNQLSDNIRASAQGQSVCRALFHRGYDQATHFINLDTII